MQAHYIRENKGHSLLIAGIVLMWVLLLTLFTTYGYKDTFELWGVPAMEPVFFDFRLIPGAAESFRNGFEPSVTNPFDPAKRIFNYPAVWRLFFYTDITQDDTPWIASLMIFLFFTGVIVFPHKLSVSGALCMLLMAFSPALMLLYERGNVDLIVFFICVLIILGLDYSVYLAGALILFGAVIKMFPLFGLTIFLREPKRQFLLLVVATVSLMLVYSYLTVESHSAAWNTTARGADRSYGTFVVVSKFGSYFQSVFPNLLSLAQWRIAFEALAVVLILLAASLALWDTQPLLATSGRNVNAFRVGASIYIGTFLLGNNWDYRLAFLILVIPQLSQWFHAGTRRHQVAAISIMVGLALSCWYFLLKVDLPFIPLNNSLHRSFVVDEVINWMLVPAFTYVLIASSPNWLKQDLRKVFCFYRTETA